MATIIRKPSNSRTLTHNARVIADSGIVLDPFGVDLFFTYLQRYDLLSYCKFLVFVDGGYQLGGGSNVAKVYNLMATDTTSDFVQATAARQPVKTSFGMHSALSMVNVSADGVTPAGLLGQATIQATLRNKTNAALMTVSRRITGGTNGASGLLGFRLAAGLATLFTNAVATAASSTNSSVFRADVVADPDIDAAKVYQHGDDLVGRVILAHANYAANAASSYVNGTQTNAPATLSNLGRTVTSNVNCESVMFLGNYSTTLSSSAESPFMAFFEGAFDINNVVKFSNVVSSYYRDAIGY